jgi:formylglycine-generating enzyme required for sulfatase activity
MVVRGSYFDSEAPYNYTSFYRSSLAPDKQSYSVGFRCAY